MAAAPCPINLKSLVKSDSTRIDAADRNAAASRELANCRAANPANRNILSYFLFPAILNSLEYLLLRRSTAERRTVGCQLYKYIDTYFASA